jgi:hypothetical protein
MVGQNTCSAMNNLPVTPPPPLLPYRGPSTGYSFNEEVSVEDPGEVGLSIDTVAILLV